MTQAQLADELGVTTKTIKSWKNDLPSKRVHALARALNVAENWIHTGSEPPRWYLVEALARNQDSVAWDTISPEEIVPAIWWEALDNALIDRLTQQALYSPLPLTASIPRVKFFTDRCATIRSQLDPKEIEALARTLKVWPTNPQLVTVIQKAIMPQSGDPPRLAAVTSSDRHFWEPLCTDLDRCATRYRKARNDHERKIKIQHETWGFLMKAPLDEPLLSGAALSQVLHTCVRVAQRTEVLFARISQLETAIEIALLSTFKDRTFTLHDLGQWLERQRGIRLVGRRNKAGIKSHDTVSEDVVLRLLKKITKEGQIPLQLRKGGRSWTSGTMNS